jgi:carboxymethylenebutenolidase
MRALIRLVLSGGFAAAPKAAKERPENSPRHHGWVGIKQGDRTVHAFFVFPETKEKVRAVVVVRCWRS